MNSLIEKNRTSLTQLCEKHKVKRLEIFGSAATGEFSEQTSDLDFLVEFDRTDEMNLADQYFGLLEDLQDLFGCDIDLVMTRAMRNPYFIESVNQTRRLIYSPS